MVNLDLSNLPINTNLPLIMHVDLNSCFASIHQQAFKHLRNKPVLIAAYDSWRSCILAPSIEAKRYGIRTGQRVFEAKKLTHAVIVQTPNVALIRDVHLKFIKILQNYSPTVIPRSIDEAVIDFQEMAYILKNRSLIDIAKEIKYKIRKDVGDWISCSIGIGTNRFLAKLAASIQKPDSLVVIDHNNIYQVYTRLKLTDLPYIKFHNQARLKAAGIFTPLQFLTAPCELLRHQVFESIEGYRWYKRLRGWEVDEIEYQRKSFRQEYVLPYPTNQPQKIASLLMNLCEKMGRRLRRKGLISWGIHIACTYSDSTSWHKGHLFNSPAYTTVDLFRRAQYLLDLQPNAKKITKIAVSCYKLEGASVLQESLFDSLETKKRHLMQAVDNINNKYGDYTIIPATMLGMKNTIPDRIAFGSIK